MYALERPDPGLINIYYSPKNANRGARSQCSVHGGQSPDSDVDMAEQESGEAEAGGEGRRASWVGEGGPGARPGAENLRGWEPEWGGQGRRARERVVNPPPWQLLPWSSMRRGAAGTAWAVRTSPISPSIGTRSPFVSSAASWQVASPRRTSPSPKCSTAKGGGCRVREGGVAGAQVESAGGPRLRRGGRVQGDGWRVGDGDAAGGGL